MEIQGFLNARRVRDAIYKGTKQEKKYSLWSLNQTNGGTKQ